MNEQRAPNEWNQWLLSGVTRVAVQASMTANFIAALRSRLEFLAEKGSWKGEVFDFAESTSAAELFER